MKTVYFVRHGECEANVNRVIAGSQNDSPLTQKGYEQAAAAAQTLKGKQIDLIISSPLIRAQQTARHISSVLGYDGEIKTESLLRERDFGVATSKPYSFFDDIDAGREIEGLESIEQLAERMRFMKERFSELPGKFILAVGHGSAEQMLHTIYEDRPYETFLETDHLDNGTFREYEVD